MEVRKPVLELKDVPPPPGSLTVSVCARCEANLHPQPSSSTGGDALPGGSSPLCPPHSLLSEHLCHLPCCPHLRRLHVCPCSFSRVDHPVPSHFCSSSLRLGVQHTLKDCCWKAGLDSEKLWPNIPPPVPVSVAVCNGCGVSGTSVDAHLKTTAKYGPVEAPVQEALPPVGVFWDIENCAVPSGRSAAAVVKRLRDRFFQGHREAEFICVCDINKENKAVIQELNNCQVTVAHINATAKNAADDKLRQSLRRFAETHTAPATVVVVSSDVNFASELSDLRHRHGFKIVLVHKSQASAALLQHAHLRLPYEQLVAELPAGMIVRSQPSFSLLFVHRLPVNRDARAVANRLQRLSNNCGGKVLGVSGGCAVLRFASGDAAERARKRMENEDVLGQRILVSFSPHGPEEEVPAPSSSSGFLPVDKARSPRRPRRASWSRHGGGDSWSPHSPRRAGHASSVSPVMKPLPQVTCVTASPSTTFPQGHGLLSADLRSRRRDSPTQPPFQVSTPSAFSKLSLQRSFSPVLLSSQSSWSSRSASPCLSSRSSPASCGEGPPEPFSDGADVQVSNLDYRMSRKDLQQILRDAFAKHGRVKSVELSPHTDYQLKARVHMSSLQQAIGAVSLLHRYKVGGKRIHVSLVTGANNKSFTCLSSEISSILQDAPAHCLPLFKFTEMYERKFGHKLVVSDLYRLPDLVCVREQSGGRLVCLLSSTQARQSPLGSAHSRDTSSTTSPVLFEEMEYHDPVCRSHWNQQDFSESDFDPDSYVIPFVVVSLKVLAAHVHSLLQSHEGTVPLLSFPECYAAEFGPLITSEEGKMEGSVPLEHLITCIPGVAIVTAQNGFKIIKWIHNKPPPLNADLWLQRSKSPVGNPQLIQFSREMVDLMKNQPSCLMPITKFIPAYHHHFAKQCRVSDYGFSKLLELLEAVPHVLQILGLGSKRLLTLTHRAQVKRFTQDLLKLLKFQASKQVLLGEFSQAYHWCFSRNWQVVDYGMCDLMDLLSEIPDTTISIFQQDSDTVVTIPKKERTADEVERTRQFGKEVVDLLRHQPHFRMSFSKFIPTYHHHFGRQCKLSYYGFSKLVELFEAIPDVLLVLECGDERVLALTEVERVKALAAQLVKLLRGQRDSGLSVQQLQAEYSRTFGYSLRLQDYDAATLPSLLVRLCHVVKVVDTTVGKEVQLINRKSLRALTSQLLALMMSLPEDCEGVVLADLRRRYELMFEAPLNPCEYGFISLSELLKSLPYLLQLTNEEEEEEEEPCVRLTRVYQFARSVRALLHTYHYNQIFLSEFWSAFSKYTGREFQPQTYGYKTLDELLDAIPQVVWIKGHGHKKIIVLKNDMRARSIPAIANGLVSSIDLPRPPSEPLSDLSRPSPEPLSDLSRPPSEPLSDLPRPPSEPLSDLSRPPSESPHDDILTRGGVELLCVGRGSPVDLLCGPVPSCLPSPPLRPHPVQSHERQPQSSDSPTRRNSRARVKLAANFSLTAMSV